MEDNEQYEGEEMGVMKSSSNMNKTNASERARRNYPKHFKGHKDEWMGMVHHQTEIKDELARIEREIKILTAKTLNTEYEKNQIALYEKRRTELLLKQKEAEEMLQKQRLYKEDMNKFRQDKVMMQNHMTEIYDQLVQEKHGIMNKYKSAELDMERSILEDNFRKMEQQQQEMLTKKERERILAQSAIKEKEKAKWQQDFESLKGRGEVKEMNKMNEMRELIKEENYKNFFKICSDNQAYYQNLHRSNVLNPFIERQEKIQQIIDKNFTEENRKKFTKEIERLKKKQEDNFLAKSVNEIQILEHQKQKELEKLEREAQNEARMKDLQDYNNFLNYKKNQKQEQMNQYKQRLDTQFDENKNKELNKLRMTKNEKKLNYNDLQAFKDVDPSLYAMIPGWSPQIGALKAPKKDTVEPMNQTNKNPMFSPNTFSAKTLVEQHFNKAAQIEGKGPIEGVSRSDFDKSGTMKNPNNASLLYGHNPILNPTPHNIQNPYLAKEFAQRKNFLSQMGKNSLF